jgi:hypothetical protein
MQQLASPKSAQNVKFANLGRKHKLIPVFNKIFL